MSKVTETVVTVFMEGSVVNALEDLGYRPSTDLALEAMDVVPAKDADEVAAPDMVIDFFELFGTTNLDIMNAVREEVIDIMFPLAGVWSWLRAWKVSEEISMLEHNYMTFDLVDVKAEFQFGRNPRKVDWQGYVDELFKIE